MLGIGRDDPYHQGVPNPRGEGSRGWFRGGGIGSGEVQTKEGAYISNGRGNTTKEKVKALIEELKVEKFLTMQKDKQL